MAERRKIITAFNDFDAELKRLTRLDEQNQRMFYAGPGRPRVGRISVSQMHLLTEAIFTRAFAKYECYMEEAFILYCRGRPTRSGEYIASYISPRNYLHARSMIKSSMPFLEWNSPDTIIERSKAYLAPDNPIFLGVTNHQVRLSRMRSIRNAIAHSSDEAEAKFRKTIRDELGIAPLTPPTVGGFLMMSDRQVNHRHHYLKSYIDILFEVANISAG